MLISDICSIKLDKKCKKFICDLLVESPDLKFTSSEISSVRSKFLHEIPGAVLPVYMKLCKGDKRLEVIFTEEYSKLEGVFSSEGSCGVLLSTETIKRLCFSNYKGKGLYGNVLESAVDIQRSYVAKSFNLEEWDCEQYSSVVSLLSYSIKMWSDRKGITSAVNLKVDKTNVVSAVDRDGNDASLVNEVVEVNTVAHYEDLLNPDLYASLIDGIKRGTKHLFGLSNQANIEGEVYSILNYYFQIEYKAFCTELTRLGFETQFNSSLTEPHKVRNARMPFTEGHFVTRVPSYASKPIGNMSNLNNIVKQGKEELARYIQYIESAKSRLSKQNCLTASMLVMDVLNSIRKTVKSYDYVIALDIINGILCADKLTSILKKNGYSILRFPIIEIRENTWSRFSCIYELLNYYRTHSSLEEIISASSLTRTYNYPALQPITILDVYNRKRTSEAVNYESYLDTNFSKLRLDNRTNISSALPKKASSNSVLNDPLAKVISVYIQDLYTAGICLFEHLEHYLAGDEIDMYFNIFRCMFVPLLGKASIEFRFCDFTSGVLKRFLADRNGVALDKICEEQILCLIDYKNSNIKDDKFSAVASYIDVLCEKLLMCRNNKNYEAYDELVCDVEFKISNCLKTDAEFAKHFTGEHRDLSVIYLLWANVNFSIVLYLKVIDLISSVLDIPNDKLLGRDVDIKHLVQQACLGAHNKDLINLFMNLTNFDDREKFYSDTEDKLLEDFVNDVEEQCRLHIFARGRIKDFAELMLFESSRQSIESMKLTIREFIKCLEQRLMNKLTTNMKQGIEEDYWQSVVAQISNAFDKASFEKYTAEQDIFNKGGSTSAAMATTADLENLPTLRGTTIIGVEEPYKEYLNGDITNEYYVFSTLGFKMLLKSRLGEAEEVTIDDINTLISKREWS